MKFTLFTSGREWLVIQFLQVKPFSNNPPLFAFPFFQACPLPSQNLLPLSIEISSLLPDTDPNHFWQSWSNSKVLDRDGFLNDKSNENARCSSTDLNSFWLKVFKNTQAQLFFQLRCTLCKRNSVFFYYVIFGHLIIQIMYFLPPLMSRLNSFFLFLPQKLFCQKKTPEPFQNNIQVSKAPKFGFTVEDKFL